LQTAGRLLAALILGLPVGFACCALRQMATHPALAWLVAHHPLWSAPALAGAATLSGLGALAGFDGAALRWWMVASASLIFLWTDR
jgi:hypothetical protein